MKPHPSRWSGPSSLLFSLVAILVLGQLLVQLTEASPIDINVANRDDLTSEEVSEMLRGDPSYVLGMLSQLRSNILKPLENNKRAIDFGLGRGYSGNQAAKHFMGLVASQYAGGPGKKRKRVDPGLLMNPKYSRPEGRSGR
eukprot:maker-scaffold294_size218657-snap-gene-0.21 protein:Tk10431 transcript:maker-scaffold294_size218657-snap-gene-0.21-mRNA-1 annotation:"diuretic hormone class 2"